MKFCPILLPPKLPSLGPTLQLWGLLGTLKHSLGTKPWRANQAPALVPLIPRLSPCPGHTQSAAFLQANSGANSQLLGVPVGRVRFALIFSRVLSSNDCNLKQQNHTLVDRNDLLPKVLSSLCHLLLPNYSRMYNGLWILFFFFNCGVFLGGKPSLW